MDIPNLRTKVWTTSAGKEVEDTKQLSGEAIEGPQMKETNETVQYKSGSFEKGRLGGEATYA